MMHGIGASLPHKRRLYAEQTGEEWPGIDYHLSQIIRQSNSTKEVIAKMIAARIKNLPDDPKRRPLGGVSDNDLLAEIAKRPKLFG